MNKLNDCPFCNINTPILLQNNTAQMILSNPRKVPGHLLVMPKRHVEMPWKLERAELEDIFEILFQVEQKLVGSLGEGCDIRQNYRPYDSRSKNKVSHLSFHLIPRAEDDYLYKISEKYEEDLFVELDSDEKNALVKLLTSKKVK